MTGLVVNQRVTLPRHLRRSFKAIVHNCERHTVSVGTAGRAGDLGIRSATEIGLPALRLIRWFAGKLPGKLRAELRARRIRVT